MADRSRVAAIFGALEIPALIVVPASLGFCAYFKVPFAAIVTMLVVVTTLIIFFVAFETRRPGLRMIMPTVVLSALAAAGRILFAAIPDVKPVSAVCIIAGVVFGKRTGFLVGTVTTLVSNFFFGQGPWTPWQMYTWGLMGYLAGVVLGPRSASLGKAMRSENEASAKASATAQPILLGESLLSIDALSVTSERVMDCGARMRRSSAGKHRVSAWLYVFAVVSCFGFGFIMNTWYLIGYVQPITLPSVIIVYSGSLIFDLVHAAGTVGFLVVLYEPWKRKLLRIREKYELIG